MCEIAPLVPEPADTRLAASALRGLDAAWLIRYREKDDAQRRSAADTLTPEAHALGLS